MMEALAALLFAHVLADFVFQTGHMVRTKHRPRTMALHGLIVLGTAVVATGSLHPVLLALAVAHVGIDLIKTHGPWRGLWPFLADQAAHLATLLLAAALVPGLFSAGLWAAASPLPALMWLVAALLLATRVGGFAIGLYMDPWAAELLRKPGHRQGLLNGGQAIGHLERGLIFLLVMAGQPGGIGFLIAAKSVLRFGTVGDDRAISEYVIIGTLASFGWAIAVSFAALHGLAALPPLGIPHLSP